MPNQPLANAVQPQATTPLARIIAAYNANQGGPEGMTLLSILAQQQDPRAQHWAQMEFQRRKDAVNGGVLPEELMGRHIPEAYRSNVPEMPISGANRVQGQPMAPGEYEAMMQRQAQADLLSRGRQSPLGREQALKNASNNIGMMWDKERINNAVMPAEYSVMGERPGGIGNFLAKLFSGQTFNPG